MAALPQSRYDLLAAEHKTLSDSVTQNDGKRHPIESYEGYKSLIARAADVFGSELIAARWLSMPSADFNGKVPLEVAQSFDYRESQFDRDLRARLYADRTWDLHVTDRDQVLDRAALFKQESIRLYRLARTKYADLSGEGAALVPGRWNATGERAIYTSTEMPMTLLERLVHTPKDRIPADLSLMEIDLSGRWEPANRDRYADSNTGLQLLVFESLAIAEQYHQDSPYSGATLALAVPSVIAPVWNVVLSPQAWRFWHHVTLSSVGLFSYDPRLFLRDAKLETA